MQKKKFWLLTFVFALAICSVFLLSSCCSPKACKVNVNFLGADPRLNLNSYSYEVDFNDSATITFKVPKGYDHTKISAEISDVNIDYTVTIDDSIYEEDYLYDSNKTITYKIENVKRYFTINIDLSKMPKLTYDITLNDNLSNFKALIIPEEKTKRFTKLTSSDVIQAVEFVNGKASIEYGNYVVLVNTSTTDNYQTLYSDLNHFTSEKNKANIGSLKYSQYDLAKKGNTNYLYDGDIYSSLYYIGQIKEDMNIYSQIPGFTPDKGFNIDRKPNTFYLFTNLSEFNNDILTMETFTTTDEPYDSTNPNLDRIGGKTVRKVSPDSIYNNRYDLHKIYLGTDLKEDILITDEDKENLRQDLYFVVSSDIGLDKFEFKLLHDAYENAFKGYLIEVSDVQTDKGKSFVRLSMEDLVKFSLKRDYVDTNQVVYEYLSGSAIFYPAIKEKVYSEDKDKSIYAYSKFYLEKQFKVSNKDFAKNDVFFNLYIKNGDGIKYGFRDYTKDIHQPDPRDLVVFQTKDLFDENDNYKGNLYLTIKGPDYKNFKSIQLKSLNFYLGRDLLTRDGFEVSNAKTFNGCEEYLIGDMDKDGLSVYTVKAVIVLKSSYNMSTALDFSELEAPADFTEGVYITDNSQFSSLSDFAFVNAGNKIDFNQSITPLGHQIKFSSSNDLYYFIKSSDPNFDIEMRLDPSDPSTVMSTSKNFCDITNTPLTLEVNGTPYKIKVIKQDIIYELLDNKIYVVKKPINM